jgi:GTPase SAR1 family protein
MDLKNKRSVSFEEASDAAKQYGFKYYECSAKSGDSVDEVFLTIARMMKQKIIDIAGKETVEEHIQLEVEKPVEKQRCCSS